MTQPLRPALPKLLVPLVASWAAIVSSCELCYRGVVVSPWLVVSALVALAVYLSWHLSHKKRIPLAALTGMVTLISLALGTAFYSNLTLQGECFTGQTQAVRLLVSEDTQQYSSSAGSEAILTLDEGMRATARIFWSDAALELPKGSHLDARGVLAPLREDQLWLYQQGIAGTINLSDIKVEGFSDDAGGAIDTFRNENVKRIQDLQSEGSGLLAGVLLGYREDIADTRLSQDFLTCGLTHLIAVSGSHLAVVSALLCWVLRRLPVGHRLELLLLILVLILYVVLTGLQPSAIRAALMAGIAGCSTLVGRRGHIPSALSAAALLMLLVYPPNAFSVGFWLSVSAVMGISLFTNLVSSWIQSALPFRFAKGPGALSSATALTITATAATLPIALPTFGVISLVGPLANLLAGPLISAVLVLGMLSLVLYPVVEPFASLLLLLSARFAEACVLLSSQLARLPLASLPLELPFALVVVICLGSAALLYLLWPSPGAVTLRIIVPTGMLVLLLSAFFVNSLTPPQLIVMDVGQGDALLVREGPRAILIDTGASESALVHALARNAVTRLDAVVITHLDEDHTGALKRLRGLVSVESVYFAKGLLTHQERNQYMVDAEVLVGREQVRELASGDELRLGKELTLQVLWPEQEARSGSNEESICLLLLYDQSGDGSVEQSALLTGDAESREIEKMLLSHPELRADILKVGHHGSSGAVTTDQLEQLQSSVALISAGAFNRYGHPSRDTLDVLDELGLRVLRTDENGDLVCRFKGAELEIMYAR